MFYDVTFSNLLKAAKENRPDVPSCSFSSQSQDPLCLMEFRATFHNFLGLHANQQYIKDEWSMEER